MGDQLQSLADNVAASFESGELWGGQIWLSVRQWGRAIDTRSVLPAGLHIGVGAAYIRSSNKDLGEIASNVPVITAIDVPVGGAVFDTHVKAGPTQSFGFHLPANDDGYDQPEMERIRNRVHGRKIFSVEGPRANHLIRLAAPIEPWVHDASRVLLLQARALELIATVSSLVSGELADEARSNDIKHAYRTREILESALASTHKLADLAQKNSVSERFLTHAFRLTFGESIGEYLTRRRMEEAHRFLNDGLSVNEAAFRVGYKANALSTAFRRYYGYPPSQIAK
ncbi:MAG: AraC family transcriptional regulator [Pseudomonadota bacterium]